MAFTALHRRSARRSQTGTTVSRCAVAVSTSSRMTLPPGQRLPDHLRLPRTRGWRWSGITKERAARAYSRPDRRSQRDRGSHAGHDSMHVVGDVEVLGVGPLRRFEIQRMHAQHLPKPRHGKHSLGKARHKGVVVRNRPFQDRHGTDRKAYVPVGIFGFEKARV